VKNCVRVGRNISNPYTVNGEDPCLLSQLQTYNYSLPQVRDLFDHIITSYSEGLGCRLIGYNSSGWVFQMRKSIEFHWIGWLIACWSILVDFFMLAVWQHSLDIPTIWLFRSSVMKKIEQMCGSTVKYHTLNFLSSPFLSQNPLPLHNWSQWHFVMKMINCSFVVLSHVWGFGITITTTHECVWCWLGLIFSYTKSSCTHQVPVLPEISHKTNFNISLFCEEMSHINKIDFSLRDEWWSSWQSISGKSLIYLIFHFWDFDHKNEHPHSFYLKWTF
jgi:hypothetical protein